DFYREVGVRKLRMDIRPRISLPSRPGRFFEFIPSISPRWTGYSDRNDLNDSGYQDRFIYEANADLLTTFVRDFNVKKFGVGKLSHFVRPSVRYTFIPDVKQTELPTFDSVDRIMKKNAFDVTLNSTLIGFILDREGGERVTHEYFYLNVSESYDVAEHRRRLTGAGDKRRPLGDLKGKLILRPTLNSKISAQAALDVYHSRLNSFDTSVDIKDKRGDELEVAYRFNRAIGSRYLEGAARLKLAKGFGLIYKNRLVVSGKTSLETLYGADFTHQCFGVEVSYTDRPSESLVMATFYLKSLGKVFHVKGERN
ncbi:MAG: LPS assembly protein LptD, partial [Thermodesulfobacteriota bacterium]